MTIDLDFKHASIRGEEARYLQLNNEGIPAHFYPANGFPLGSYTHFLNRLSNTFQLNCLSLRACWPNIHPAAKETKWELYADDLIDFIEQRYDQPIIAIGHSQGASSSLIAAAKRPDLFKSLVLIEPASVSASMALLMKVTPYFIKAKIQPVKGALQKRDIWQSREEFYQYCQNNRAYKRLDAQVLKDFAQHGLKPIEGGKFALTFSTAWEASNYALAISTWKYLKQVKVPVQVLAGKPNIFFSPKLREQWQTLPNLSLQVANDYGHLFPLEAPGLCADMIMSKH